MTLHRRTGPPLTHFIRAQTVIWLVWGKVAICNDLPCETMEDTGIPSFRIPSLPHGSRMVHGFAG